MRTNLADFAARINNDARLVQMISDWDRVILVRPTDGVAPETLVVSGGQVRLAETAEHPSIVLEAPAAVLSDIFSGRSTPTEPYLDGTLRVLGTQEDVIRLDFLSLMIWGA